jgi:hypothetical protein
MASERRTRDREPLRPPSKLQRSAIPFGDFWKIEPLLYRHIGRYVSYYFPYPQRVITHARLPKLLRQPEWCMSSETSRRWRSRVLVFRVFRSAANRRRDEGSIPHALCAQPGTEVVSSRANTLSSQSKTTWCNSGKLFTCVCASAPSSAVKILIAFFGCSRRS